MRPNGWFESIFKLPFQTLNDDESMRHYPTLILPIPQYIDYGETLAYICIHTYNMIHASELSHINSSINSDDLIMELLETISSEENIPQDEMGLAFHEAIRLYNKYDELLAHTIPDIDQHYVTLKHPNQSVTQGIIVWCRDDS